MGRTERGRPTRPATRRLLTIAVLTGGMLMTANCASPDATSSTSSTIGTSSTGGTSGPVPSFPGGTPSSGATPGGTDYVPSPEPELTVPGGPVVKTERLSGVIAAGTESGCRLLQLDQGRAVQIIGGDERIRVGAQVTIEGRRVPGMATTCQEGTPFVVSAVIAVTPNTPASS